MVFSGGESYRLHGSGAKVSGTALLGKTMMPIKHQMRNVVPVADEGACSLSVKTKSGDSRSPPKPWRPEGSR